MSFEAMTWASAQKCGSSGAKFVLMMLADHANGHTGQCNPRIKRIAELCEMSESSVKNHIKTLEGMGLLRIEARYVDGVQVSNQYWLNLGGVGQNLTQGGSKSDPGVGQNLTPVNQEVFNLEVNQVKPSRKSSPVTFSCWLKKLKEQGQTPIPEDDSIFDYADEAQLPAKFVVLHWYVFKQRYADNEKKYIDWRAVFRDSFRRNWFKLWYYDAEKGIALTSIGQQNMAALEARRSEK